MLKSVQNLDLDDGYVVIGTCEDLCISWSIDSLREVPLAPTGHTYRDAERDLPSLCKQPTTPGAPRGPGCGLQPSNSPWTPHPQTGTSTLDSMRLLRPRFMGRPGTGWSP